MSALIQTDQVKSLITGNNNLVKVIGETMSVERFTEAATSLLQNPAIAACTQDSVLGCLLKAAIFGFRISPELGQCWIVPRNMVLKGADGKDLLDHKGSKQWVKQASFQVGYKGWMELAFRSGEVESFDAQVIRANDEFDFAHGTNAFLKFKCGLEQSKRGNVLGVFACATMRSGRVVFNIADFEEIERHRKMSDTQSLGGQVSNTPVGIWGKHWDAMAKRIPLRNMCTLQLPKNELMQRAIEADGGITQVTDHEVIETTPIQVHEQEKAPELHETYIDEVKACKTKDALKNLYKDRAPRMDANQLKTYYAAITEHAETLQA